jgi:transcription elongation factor Elf1
MDAKPTMESECPFCAHDTAAVVQLKSGQHVVECLRCKARGPTRRTRDLAVIAWNERTAREQRCA